MAHRRAEMNGLGVTPASQLAQIPNGRLIRIAGAVIMRQRPGTANGFVFLSLQDETGVMNAIITPLIFDQYKQKVLTQPPGKAYNIRKLRNACKDCFHLVYVS